MRRRRAIVTSDPVLAPPADATGYGEAPTAEDLRWIEIGTKLTPADTLARVNANARATVTSVALIGTLLTGLGLASAQTLLATQPARSLALAAVAVAVLAVVCGLVYLGLRRDRVNPEDAEAVKRWYGKQLAWAWLAVVASWLLVLAVLLGAAAGISGVVQAGSPNAPTLGLSIAGSGDARRLDVRVDVSGLDAGSEVSVQVVALPFGGCPEVLIFDGRHLADRAGKVAIASSVSTLPCNDRFTLAVSGGDVKERTLTVP